VRAPGVRENNIGNGGKHKKGVTIKTQKQGYEVLVYKGRLMLKVVTRPAQH
jgi:hypothetical protein